MNNKRVYVVPHSHWDREWYFTIEDSNILLIENLDYLMDVLEENLEFTSYCFDAQASLIDEYLKIRPENKERLQKLIQEKRIFFGPWYTQTDTLLVHKESIIRNLLYGTRISDAMGGSMKIGYLPDIFGQNAYLPSFFQEFDMEYSILQRGIYTDQLQNNLNFIWKSPDGKQVKANNIYLGYGPGKFLVAEKDYVEETLLPMLEKLAELNEKTDNLLLPSGGDQVLVRKEMPKIVAELNKQDLGYEFILSDYETFMEETWREAEKFDNVIEGELLASQKSRIHNTIRSQRYDIKKWNHTVEHKILDILEPLAMIGQSLGLNYPQNWLDDMWKKLFDVHAHDSIGGCNSDETNQNIMNRLHNVNRMADGLINLIKKQITQAISNKLGKDNIFVVFNTNGKKFTGYIDGIIFTKDPAFTIVDLAGHDVPFEIMEQEYLSGGKRIVVTAEGEKEEEIPGYYRTVVQIVATDLPALGYQTFEIVEGKTSATLLKETKETTIENETLALSFSAGKLSLQNKASGKLLENFLRFENTADAGDSYDYSPLEGDKPIYFDEAELVIVEKGNHIERLTVKHVANIPASLEERGSAKVSGNLEIITHFELRKKENFLRITHEIDNTNRDHRVRVLLNTPVENPEMSFADQGFSILQRPTVNPYLANWREQKFAEAPVPIYTLENVAGVFDQDFVFAVATKGLKEYEVVKETGEFALTLFRSVGLLGRDDLLWRPGRASGINNRVVYTPDAQMLQKMTFDYSIYFAKEEFKPEQIFTVVDQYRGAFTSYQKQSLNSFEERLERFSIPYPIAKASEEYSLLEVGGEGVFLSVCKRAYEDEATIIRLFNPTEEPKEITLQSPYFDKWIKTNLKEQELEEIEKTIVVPPKGYTTLKGIKKK